MVDGKVPLSQLSNATETVAGIAEFATDAETQISAAVPEDYKMVSRVKLFNWWYWILGSLVAFRKKITVEGIEIGRGNNSFSTNIAIGDGALGAAEATGIDNIALGDDALSKSTIGRKNISIGLRASENSVTAQSNIILGYEAGRYLITGQRNVCIGETAAGVSGLTSLNYGVIIGSYARPLNNTGSTNEIVIGDGVTGNGSQTVTIGKSNYIANYFFGKLIVDTLAPRAGTTTKPPLILEPAPLTTVPINGAVERDLNGNLHETHGGVRSPITPTRFGKNVSPGMDSIAFYKSNSVSGDKIPVTTITGSGRIYPNGLDSITGMISDDVIESSFIFQKQIGPTSNDYALEFEFYSATTDNGFSSANHSFNYQWELATLSEIYVKIIFTRKSDLTANGYIISYIILINGFAVYVTPDHYSWTEADCRMFLRNNNVGTNQITIKQLQATNLFIPASNTL